MEENMVIENESTEVVEEKAKPESKVGGFFKRHGKKIAAGVAIGVAYVIGKAVGKKQASNSDNCDGDYIETDFSEVDTNE